MLGTLKKGAYQAFGLMAPERGKSMSVVSMAKDIKKVHPNFVICYKVGTFVQVLGKDAYEFL